MAPSICVVDIEMLVVIIYNVIIYMNQFAHKRLINGLNKTDPDFMTLQKHRLPLCPSAVSLMSQMNSGAFFNLN